MTADQIRDRLRRAVKAEGSQRQLARRIGISQQHLCDLLSGRRNPGPTVLSWLGLERAYRRVR